MKRLLPVFSFRPSGAAVNIVPAQGAAVCASISAMALALLILLACGGLVSCKAQEAAQSGGSPEAPAVPAIAMETQYYDTNGNYIEIPTLVLPDGAEASGAIAAINAALDNLRSEYQLILKGAEYGTASYCLFYPSTTSRYLNLIFFQSTADYGCDGDICSWVYDKKTGQQVTVEDALELAGTTWEDLCGGLEQQIADDPEDSRSLYEPAKIVGFRVRTDGKVVFYLAAYVDWVDLGDDGFYDDWYRLYIWEDGAYARYECMFTLHDQYPLVPAEETDQLAPPLWCQWYFTDGEPEGGFADAPSGAAFSDGEVSSAGEAEADPQLNGLDGSPMREAYADVLERLLLDDIAPGGETPALFADDSEFNQFALWDVDLDGAQELVLLYASTVYAGYSGYILAYDEASGSVYTQLVEFPDLTFYGNGAVAAGWSHSQGWSGRFQPYNLYQYDPDSDSYTFVGSADAWDREISDHNEGFTPFPTELDTSGTGFLYYIQSDTGEYDPAVPLDASVYQAWLDTYTEGTSECSLPYLPLTEENIRSLRTGA